MTLPLEDTYGMKYGLDLGADTEKAFDYFIDRLEELEIVVTVEGDFAYYIGERRVKQLTQNQVKSMLRKDYIKNEVGPYTGNQLGKRLELFFVLLKHATKDTITNNLKADFVKSATLVL